MAEDHLKIYNTICKDRLDSLDEKLDTIVSALNGDGNGKPGLRIRIDRIEQCAAMQKKVIVGLMGIVSPLLTAALITIGRIIWSRIAN